VLDRNRKILCETPNFVAVAISRYLAEEEIEWYEKKCEPPKKYKRNTGPTGNLFIGPWRKPKLAPKPDESFPEGMHIVFSCSSKLNYKNNSTLKM